MENLHVHVSHRLCRLRARDPAEIREFSVGRRPPDVFPVTGPREHRRRAFFVLDRRKLAYLNGIEKVNRGYCSYANGLLAYVREVAARTEEYWCPIKTLA
jgi:hypothetical protein